MGMLLAMLLLGGGLWVISERVVMERAAAADLNEMASFQARSSWNEAGAALERARGRLGGRGSVELRRRLDQGTRDLALVARLEAIRMGRGTSVGGFFSKAQADDGYEAAFRGAGYGRMQDAPEVVAGRVRSSIIWAALVASLRYEATASGRVTRRASSDPACIAGPKGIGSPSGKALSGRRRSLCTSGRPCPMCGGTASTTS
jgi:serine/threonine-protein kinase